MSISRAVEDIRHPLLRRHEQERREDVNHRLADTITRFAGSMPFVYLHAVWFAAWILLRVEPFPFGLLTMIVSLEAIFLTAFVLISQNRADDKRGLIAEHHWETIETEGRRIEELVGLTREILAATKAQQAIQRVEQSRSPRA